MRLAPLHRRGRRGFLLVEVILAVAMFAIAMVALASCVDSLIAAQIIRKEDEKVRRFLDSRMAEIEAGAVPLQDSYVEDIKDWMPGMKLKTTRKVVNRTNQDNQPITGIYLVTMEVTWLSDNQQLGRSLQFYIYPRQR